MTTIEKTEVVPGEDKARVYGQVRDAVGAEMAVLPIEVQVGLLIETTAALMATMTETGKGAPLHLLNYARGEIETQFVAELTRRSRARERRCGREG